uniref:Uncharacterized protein n=1 Tax=Tetranychus urticae TaxID=32264 RepID=T1KAT2_TETUR
MDIQYSKMAAASAVYFQNSY